MNALRKYDIKDIVIGGDKDCKHEWGSEYHERKRGTICGKEAQCEIQKPGTYGTSVNHGSFCIHCNAWKGQYGLEPTPDCGQPFMRLKEDLTPKEKEYILDELRKHGAI